MDQWLCVLLDNEIAVLGTVYSLFLRPKSVEVSVRKGKEKSYLMATGDWRLLRFFHEK